MSIMSVGILLFLTYTRLVRQLLRSWFNQLTCRTKLPLSVYISQVPLVSLAVAAVAVETTRRHDIALLSSETNLSMSSVMLYISSSFFRLLLSFSFAGYVCETFTHAVAPIPSLPGEARTLGLHVIYINGVYSSWRSCMCRTARVPKSGSN